MKRINKLLLAMLFGHTIATEANTDIPHTFSAGSPALASEVNENFSTLDERLDALEGSTLDVYVTMEVDCSESSSALADSLENARNANSRIKYLITGPCEGGEISRADIRIEGTSGDASITKSDELEGESLFIDAQSNVRLTNLTVEGPIYVRNNSNLRLENVGLLAPVQDGDGYESNIYMKSSYLRINSGSIDELSLQLYQNASADIRSAVTGKAYQVIADGSSALTLQSDTATYELIEAIGNSFVHSHSATLTADTLQASGSSSIEANSLEIADSTNIQGSSQLVVHGNANTGDFVIIQNSAAEVTGNISADLIEASNSSTIDASSLEISELVDIWGSSYLVVRGGVDVGESTSGHLTIFQNSAAQIDGTLSTGTMECSNSSSFDVDGELETRGSIDWSGGNFGLAVQRGCFGRYGESNSDTLTGGYFIDKHSEVYSPSWEPLSEM